jgi:TonB family protein
MLVALIAKAQDTSKTYTAGVDVFTKVEVMPEFVGGHEAMTKFITANIKYPESSKTNKEEGTVLVQFVVDPAGKIILPKVVKGVSAALDAEALRVVHLMPAWTPGKQGGKAVNVAYTVPISFKL